MIYDAFRNLLEGAYYYLILVINWILEYIPTSTNSFSSSFEAWSGIANLIQGTAFGIVAVLTLVNIINTTLVTHDWKRLEPWIKPFLRFGVSQSLIVVAPTLFTRIVELAGDVITAVIPSEFIITDLSRMTQALDMMLSGDAGVFEQIGFNIALIIITIVLWLLIISLAVIIMVTIVTRVYKLIIYASISPLALAFFASESNQQTSLEFIRKFMAIALQGFVIVVILVLYGAVAKVEIIKLTEGSGLIEAIIVIVEDLVGIIILTALIRQSEKIANDLVGTH